MRVRVAARHFTQTFSSGFFKDDILHAVRSVIAHCLKDSDLISDPLDIEIIFAPKADGNNTSVWQMVSRMTEMCPLLSLSFQQRPESTCLLQAGRNDDGNRINVLQGPKSPLNPARMV